MSYESLSIGFDLEFARDRRVSKSFEYGDMDDTNFGSIDSPTESGLQMPFIRPDTITSRR